MIKLLTSTFLILFLLSSCNDRESNKKTISSITLPNGQTVKILSGLDRQTLANNFVRQGLKFTPGRSVADSYLDIYATDNGETKISVFGKDDSGVYLITGYVSRDNSSFKTKDFISYLGWIASDSIMSSASNRWAVHNFNSHKTDTTFSNAWHYTITNEQRICTISIEAR